MCENTYLYIYMTIFEGVNIACLILYVLNKDLMLSVSSTQVYDEDDSHLLLNKILAQCL